MDTIRRKISQKDVRLEEIEQLRLMVRTLTADTEEAKSQAKEFKTQLEEQKNINLELTATCASNAEDLEYAEKELEKSRLLISKELHIQKEMQQKMDALQTQLDDQQVQVLRDKQELKKQIELLNEERQKNEKAQAQTSHLKAKLDTTGWVDGTPRAEFREFSPPSFTGARRTQSIESDSDQEIFSIRSELDQCQTYIQKLQTKESTLQQQLSQNETDANQWRAEALKLKDELKNVTDSRDELQQHVQELMAKQEQDSMADEDGHSKDGEVRVAELTEQLKEVRSQLVDAEKEKDMLEEEFERCKCRMAHELDSMRSNSLELEEIRHNEERHHEEARALLAEIVPKLEREKTIVEAELDQARKNIESLQGALDDGQHYKKTFDTEKAKLETEIEEAHQTIHSLKEEVGNCQQRLQQSQSLEEEKNKSQERQDVIAQENEELQNKYNIVVAENEKLNTALAEAEAKNEKLNVALPEAKEKIMRLEEAFANLPQPAVISAEDNKPSDTEVQMGAAIDTLREALQEETQLKNQAESKVVDLTNQISQLKNEAESKVVDLTNQISQLKNEAESEVVDLTNQVFQLKNQAESEVVDLTNQISQLQATQAKLIEAHEQEKMGLEAQLSQLGKVLETHQKSQEDNVQERNISLTQELMELQSNNKKLLGDQEVLQNNLVQLQQENDGLKAHMAKTMARVAEEKTALESSCQQADREISVVKDSLKRATENSQDKNRVLELENKVHYLEDHVKRHQELNQQLQQSLKASQGGSSENVTADKRILQLKQQILAMNECHRNYVVCISEQICQQSVQHGKKIESLTSQLLDSQLRVSQLQEEIRQSRNVTMASPMKLHEKSTHDISDSSPSKDDRGEKGNLTRVQQQIHKLLEETSRRNKELETDAQRLRSANTNLKEKMAQRRST